MRIKSITRVRIAVKSLVFDAVNLPRGSARCLSFTTPSHGKGSERNQSCELEAKAKKKKELPIAIHKDWRKEVKQVLKAKHHN